MFEVDRKIALKVRERRGDPLRVGAGAGLSLGLVSVSSRLGTKKKR